MKTRINFRSKLIFSHTLVVLISFTLAFFILDRKLEENSLCNIKSSLLTQAGIIQRQLSIDSIKIEDPVSLNALIEVLHQETKSRITIIKADGTVLADSEKNLREVAQMENHLYRPEIKEALTGRTGIDTRYSPTLKIDMLYAAIPVRDKDDVVGVLRLSLPLESVRNTLQVIRNTILMVLLFALILACLLALLLSSQITGPIDRLVRISHRFSKGDFSRRMIQAPRDEIGDLAALLNDMAQDMEGKIKEIESQNQKLAAIFNSMIEGVIVVDKSGNVVSINRAIENIFNVSKRDVEGKNFLESVRNNELSEIINSAIKRKELVSAEIDLVYPVRKTFQINALPIADSGCLAVIHDITDIRRLETVRSDFIANISHELKTPLTSIKGFVETLLEGGLEDEENNRQFLEIIHNHSQRLNKLVDDLLSLSYLETNLTVLDKENFKLRQQVEEIILGFKSQTKKKKMNIVNDLPSTLTIKADKEKMEHVFINLIDNAIKFNKEKGSIHIYCKDLDTRIKITVEDSGIGIPEKDCPRIFERFYRVDKARSRDLGGTGLGLSIVKHIVELHGGSAGLDSVEGMGSKFWIILPK